MPAIEPRLLEPRTDTTGPVTAEARLALTFSGRQSAKAAKVTVAFSEDTSVQQVTMNVDARGLAPNTEYGLHIHVYGDSSSDDALAMAGHFNPDASPHGCPILPENSRSPAEARPGTHYGDFGNLLTDSTGSSSQTFTSHFLSLRNASAPGYVPGRGVILHTQRDDCETQPTGNAGARLAQGVIALKDGKGEGTWKGVEGDAVDAIGVFDAHVAGSVVATRSSATGLDLLLNLTGLAFGETYKLSVGTFEVSLFHFAGRASASVGSMTPTTSFPHNKTANRP
ncbi:Copper/zinc superoxide dismutase-domain-containing protein [Chytriomyces sp. MP71]|nr:Copper/zinc superoxide dismutase-domain-containing protein [Chytriomyces sp. MP71]